MSQTKPLPGIETPEDMRKRLVLVLTEATRNYTNYCINQTILADDEARGTINRDVMDTVEKTMLQQVMAASIHNQHFAAKRLGINRMTLRKRLSRYNLPTCAKEL